MAIFDCEKTGSNRWIGLTCVKGETLSKVIIKGILFSMCMCRPKLQQNDVSIFTG